MVEKLIGVSPYTGGIIFFYSSFFSMINLINLPMCRILSSYKEHTNLPISTRIFKFDNPNLFSGNFLYVIDSPALLYIFS